MPPSPLSRARRALVHWSAALAHSAPSLASAWLALVIGASGLAVLVSPSQPVDEPRASEPVEVLVVLHNGQRFAGILLSDSDEEVVLRAGGAPVYLPRDEIASITPLPPVMERYRTLREGVDDDDLTTRLRLVEWLIERNRIRAASEELDDILSRDPTFSGARRLRRELDARIELERRLAARRTELRRRAEERVRPGRDGGVPLLSEEQINLIKVYEVDLDDPPPMRIGRETITKLMREHAGSPLIPATRDAREALYAEPAARILELMFRLRARNLYGEVEVVGDPASMRLFRARVHGAWLMNSCATSACHGGTEAGELRLVNRRRNREETIYTNFLILDRFRLSDGTPLIDYRDPERSPLLHMGLLREQSLYPHPVVPSAPGARDRWSWVFRTTEDRHFRTAVEWISRMYTPRPEYPIEYPPPERRVRAEGEPEPPSEKGGGG